MAFTYPNLFSPDEAFARDLDGRDPLRPCRDWFHLPCRANGEPQIYFCSHSLGLQPKTAAELMQAELTNWARLGVEGHFHGPMPWYTYQELLRGPMARLVGALPSEAVLMNGLTVNLHLMMTSFFRPTPERFKILIEEPTFPSDLYAVKSQLRWHGLDPPEALLSLKPRVDEHVIRDEDIAALLEREGARIALVLLNGVNFFTGQSFDIGRITKLAQDQGCIMGWDLAHAVGNVPLTLHDWNVDFAVWCTYKYLCAGPGAVGGCFVHERHGRRPDLARLAGWWGNDPATRFRMQLQPEFTPHVGADGWQVSNPPILALATLRASLDIFDAMGMSALSAKADCLTGYLFFLLDQLSGSRCEVLTPREPGRHGCQVSLLIRDQARELFDTLTAAGVIGDFRAPNVIRFAPVPLYNTFHEVWRLAQMLVRHVP